MTHVTLICCALFIASIDANDVTSPPLKGYPEAAARFGRDAGGEVQLALWCEAHGLSAERVKHLAGAVLLDPTNTAARGLLGLVGDGNGWQRPEAVAERAKADAALAEYNARRARTPDTAEAQWALALWCEQNGLKPEALAHLTAVTRLEPRKAAAWKHLGYRRHGDRWMTAAQIAGEKAEADAQAAAGRKWRPRLDRLKGLLGYKDRERRAQAEAEIAAVTDPLAVPSVVAVFWNAHAGEAAQRTAVQLLGQIDAPESSRALAEIAARSGSDVVRRAAAETLRRRDPRDFLDRLLARLDDPVRYHVRPVGGPGEPGEILIEGPAGTLDRVYAPPPRPVVPLSPGSRVDRDAAGSLVVWVANVVPGTAVFNSLTPALTWAMIAGSFDPVIQSAPTRPDRFTGPDPRRDPRAVARVIAASLGANSGLMAVPFILNPLAMWVASPDGVRTQAPIAPGSPLWSINTRDETAMPQPPIAVPVGAMNAEIEKAAYEARGQQREDVRGIDLHNAGVRKGNDPIVALLIGILGESSGASRADWDRWWTDRRGYATRSTPIASKPVDYEQVALDYTPRPVGRFRYDRQIGYYTPPSSSCFAAGTPVRTMTGPRAIETIEAGDRVLAQDPNTGALAYRPVLSVAHNPPAPTVRVATDAGAIVSTPIHRFWKAREGWVMARDLKPGDSVRTLGGLAKVVSVEDQPTRPVFNLEVDAAHDFFAGPFAALVHDTTLVHPVAEPFDAAAGGGSP